MLDKKSILASRTVWANLVGLVALALGLLGFETRELDQAALVESILQIVAAASFVLSTFFRILATRQLRA
ncbi:MAG TPA: hypothetical protein VHG30_13870 [Microvirga sp.]|jgi:hypothetical protein|nr:hypothetical protein [Microvirga sp.]